MAAAKPARSPAAVRWLALWLALAAASLGRAESPVAEEVVLLANRDDDDRDGVADADDDRVNGPADGDDLAVVRLAAPPGTRRLRIAADDAPLRFFARDGGGWRHLGRGAGELAVPAAAAEEGIDLGIEAIAWAGLPAEWTGRATIRVAFEGSDAAPRELAVRVAPVVLLPATAPVAEVYVATGRYDNAGFIAALEGVLEPLAVPLRTHAARDWKEMWMQDTMEIGIATTPRASMHVVLAGLRNADSFPPTLLGPDVAIVAAATFRPLGGGEPLGKQFLLIIDLALVCLSGEDAALRLFLGAFHARPQCVKRERADVAEFLSLADESLDVFVRLLEGFGVAITEALFSFVRSLRGDLLLLLEFCSVLVDLGEPRRRGESVLVSTLNCG